MIKRGDIVLIKFPFSDLSSTKFRPALVISADTYTENGMDAIFMLITSKIDNPQKTDILIDIGDSEFAITGLKKSSLIRADKIAVLTKTLATRKLGEIGSNTLKKVEKILADVLGLKVSTIVPAQTETPLTSESNPQ
jgi:mRNA interferase MazF